MNKVFLSILSGVAAAFTIGVLASSSIIDKDLLLLMAPFGATAVLVFGLPDSPLAQTKNVILGHLLAATIGIIFSQYLGVSPLSLGIATGLAITCMLLSNTTHPPAGANPMLIMLANEDWTFLVTPVLFGSLIIVLLGLVHKHLRKRLIPVT